MERKSSKKSVKDTRDGLSTRTKLILALTIVTAIVLLFFGGYTTGHYHSNDSLRMRLNDTESQLTNCSKKLTTWCNGGRLRAIECGDDVHACICVSAQEIQKISNEQ